MGHVVSYIIPFHIDKISLLLTATVLPFGVAAGDELVQPAIDGTSGPVSLSYQFYGMEEDTVYVSRSNLHKFHA